MKRLFEFVQHIGDWRVLVGTRDIRDGAVTTEKIADGAVTISKLSPNDLADANDIRDLVEDVELHGCDCCDDCDCPDYELSNDVNQVEFRGEITDLDY